MRLTKQELKAIKGLESYYGGLDYIDTDAYGEFCQEYKDASEDEQAILRALTKLIKMYEVGDDGGDAV